MGVAYTIAVFLVLLVVIYPVASWIDDKIYEWKEFR